MIEAVASMPVIWYYNPQKEFENCFLSNTGGSLLKHEWLKVEQT